MIAILRGFVAIVLGAMACSASALAPDTLHDLALGDNDAKAKGIAAAAASGDISALPLLQALLDGEVQTVGDAQILLVKGDTATDLVTGKSVTPLPDNRDDVVINNRIRKDLGTAIAALKLTAPDRSTRLVAAKELQTGADEDLLPVITTAIAKETDAEIKGLLSLTRASIQLSSTDKDTRLAAVRALADNAAIRTPRRCCSASSSRRTETTPSPTPMCGPKPKNRCAPFKAGFRRAKWSGGYSAASRSAAFCCWPRWASPSPTA